MFAVNKGESIYFQLLKLLIVSFFAAIIAFAGLNYFGNYVIDAYFYNSEYEKKKNIEYLDKLQNYINSNHLSSRNTEELKKWTKKQKIIVLRIYKDNKIIFSSDYPDEAIWEEDVEADAYEWETYYSVSFTDGSARAGMIGLYEYQLYTYVMIAELLISFVLFLTLVLFGIRRKMQYISRLCDEIGILEGGSLNYAITIKGKDELTALAEGLDHMRLSFRHMIEHESEIMNENKRIITEISHDLRTPITSIMLYTEILKKENYNNKAQLSEYLDKISGKVLRMKQLTDHLFEYTLVSCEKEIELEEAEFLDLLFFDLFSETCSYLIQNGFDVDFSVKWTDHRISVFSEYVARIIDNISSNILKYADQKHKVKISSAFSDNMIGFVFENRKKDADEKQESNGVGLQSINNMMCKMGGKCKISQDNEIFRMEILFPFVN